jgi:phospholipase C
MLCKIKRRHAILYEMDFELLYYHFVSILFKILDPFKKIFIKTECKVHLFNNKEAVKLLGQYGYKEAYTFYKSYIREFNKGAVWADQNFKSSNHFYNPNTQKGMFGRSHAKYLAERYYYKALRAYQNGHYGLGMFFLGACTHVAQDLTVPQHVKVRLLGRHRKYENFVKYTYDIVEAYKSVDPPIILNNVRQYVEYNARIALKLDKAYHDMFPLKKRYFKITLNALPLAQTSTAGIMLLFLKELDE